MRREIGGNILKLLFFIACGYGIVRLSIWSFFQTQLFFVPFDAPNSSTISTALAFVFQYGQNIALFMAAMSMSKVLAYKNKKSTTNNQTHVSILNDEIRKATNIAVIYYCLFGVFALVDGGTNVGQFFSSTAKDAEVTLTGWTLTGFMAVGTLVCVVVVFVEELFMDTVNAILHAFNDVMESIGTRRIPSLDLFVDPDVIIATKLDERTGGRNKSSGYTMVQKSTHGSARRQELESQRLAPPQPAPRAVPITQRAYPTYHPAPKTRDGVPFDMDGEDGDE
jgi:hypothetical protein